MRLIVQQHALRDNSRWKRRSAEQRSRARWRPSEAMLSGMLLMLGLLGATPEAAAYCRTSTCVAEADPGVKGARCIPESTRPPEAPISPDCGTPIAWKRGCIGFAVNERGSREVPVDQATRILQRAVSTWQQAPCNPGNPGLAIVDLGTVACGGVEYNQHDGNANVVLFRDDDWPHEGALNALALTTTTFDRNTGEIFDADIEVNAFGVTITTGDDEPLWDLQGILTHEVGHALGLAHSADSGATMGSSVMPQTLSFRQLGDDDVQAICAAYPPSTSQAERCNPIPRHGFSPECKDGQTEGKCSISAARAAQPRRADRPFWLALLALAPWLRRRLHRQNNRVRS